jgi:hypothetical protein
VNRYEPKKVKRPGHGVNYKNCKQENLLSDFTKDDSSNKMKRKMAVLMEEKMKEKPGTKS